MNLVRAACHSALAAAEGRRTSSERLDDRNRSECLNSFFVILFRRDVSDPVGDGCEQRNHEEDEDEDEIDGRACHFSWWMVDAFYGVELV